MLNSKLQNAYLIIRDYIKSMKQDIKSFNTKEQKEQLKRVIRSLVIYKFANKVSMKIAELKAGLHSNIETQGKI